MKKMIAALMVVTALAFGTIDTALSATRVYRYTSGYSRHRPRYSTQYHYRTRHYPTYSRYRTYHYPSRYHYYPSRRYRPTRVYYFSYHVPYYWYDMYFDYGW